MLLYVTVFASAGFRSWLQHNFKLGIPIFFGYWGVPFGLVPKKVEIGLEVSTYCIVIIIDVLSVPSIAIVSGR